MKLVGTYSLYEHVYLDRDQERARHTSRVQVIGIDESGDLYALLEVVPHPQGHATETHWVRFNPGSTDVGLACEQVIDRGEVVLRWKPAPPPWWR